MSRLCKLGSDNVSGGSDKKLSFSWLAFIIAGSLFGIQLAFATLPIEGGNPMPMLTQMLVNEFGLGLSLIGVGVGIYQFKGAGATYNGLTSILLCAASACGYLWIGMPLWQTIFN